AAHHRRQREPGGEAREAQSQRFLLAPESARARARGFQEIAALGVGACQHPETLSRQQVTWHPVKGCWSSPTPFACRVLAVFRLTPCSLARFPTWHGHCDR